jgi:hypothetical protein
MGTGSGGERKWDRARKEFLQGGLGPPRGALMGTHQAPAFAGSQQGVLRLWSVYNFRINFLLYQIGY